MNAFERGDELVIDLVAFEDSSIIDALYLDERGPVAALPPSELRRYTIGLDSGERAPRAARRGHRRAAADRLRAPQHPRLPLRVLRRRASRELARPAREGRRGPGRGGVLERAGLLPRRADLRARSGRGGRGRRRDPVGGARHPRPAAPSCSCSTRARSRSWPGPRRRITSRSASTGSTCDERAGLLASDAEREAAAERLRNAAGEGRLAPEELEQRLGVAFGARTRGELDSVVADLPGNGRAGRARPGGDRTCPSTSPSR